MKKCKWAGDVNDEYCKGCDGITMEVDGNSIPCTECAGYEEDDEDVESTVEKTEKKRKLKNRKQTQNGYCDAVTLA